MRRNKDVHKNDFGHVLVVAGSPSMLGAAALTGLASMRAGAGLTTIAVARSLNLTLQKKISPVIMTLPLPETDKTTIALSAAARLKKNWREFSAVALGPGMTTNRGTVSFIKQVFKSCPLPLVIDADALNALARFPNVLERNKAVRILTPHPGEMARLTRLTKHQVEADRKRIALDYARRWHCVLVLKGAKTVVASPTGKVYINRSGNAGMATAGSGDVLTGMLAALIAQGIPPFEAARFGVWWHGHVGDQVVKRKAKYSLIATDLIDGLSIKWGSK